MTGQIEAGAIMVREGTLVPDSVRMECDPWSKDWGALSKPERRDFEVGLAAAGWTLFYMAGEMKTTVFGFNKEKALRTALNRVMGDVTSQHLNCMEVTQLTTSSFLGIPSVSVCAHARHIQGSSVLKQR